MEATHPKLCFLTLALFLLISLSSAAKCSESQKKVLLEIKNKLNPNDLAFSDWNPQNNPDCCNWFGLACNSKAQITSLNLNLDSFGPALPIPTAIGDLPFLQSLHIHGNLTGPIPVSISDLTYLQTLELSSGLTGPIPPSLGRLRRLTSLDLSLNSLTGSIPSTLGNMAGLTNIDLSNNKLSGRIPSSLGVLVKLGKIDFSSNFLTGRVPSVATMLELNRLDLRANRLSGSIPSHCVNLNNPRLQLFFGQNELSGPVPHSFWEANVSVIDLSMNQLIGDVSFLFGKRKTALETVYINHNNFKFDFSRVELPMSLRNLDIQHNKIYGSLPKNIGQISWDYLDVSNNRLCGMIPAGLEQFSPDKFANNKCLCGPPLPPCYRSHSEW